MQGSVLGDFRQLEETADRGIREFSDHPERLTPEEETRVCDDLDTCLGRFRMHWPGIAYAVFDAIGWRNSARICLTLLEEYLPAFRSMHPRNRSYAGALRRIRRRVEGRQRALLPKPNLRRYRAPGSGHFGSAINGLTQAVNMSLQQQGGLGEIFAAVVNEVITAWRMHAWGRAYPGQYRLFLGVVLISQPRFRRPYVRLPSDQARVDVILGWRLYAPGALLVYQKLKRLAGLIRPHLDHLAAGRNTGPPTGGEFTHE